MPLYSSGILVLTAFQLHRLKISLFFVKCDKFRTLYCLDYLHYFGLGIVTSAV